ncbi:MAG TPA: TetR/AcrR family transcriptional regulator [Anaeromyxobacteraceae bacterium]|nr:TetR/AcrR family transcriptional regulator [Anaeromyxobacteraceae bacterium]
MRRRGLHPGTAERRREIFCAALECFAEIGFSQTTMADIRRRAKASTGSIYHQFESKEHLAAEIFLEGIADYQAGWIAALERETDARGGLRAVIGHHLRWVRSNETWARYLFQRRHSAFTAAAERKLAELNAEFLRRASLWFATHMEAGRLRRLPPDIYIALVAGPYTEHTRHYLSGRDCTNTEEVIEMLADAAWRSLAVRPDQPGSARERGQPRTSGGAR